mmetsp:Transcript_33518/g.76629  ORF Transcript_33518/g.76629 Transcript_33518/m.76629 type:complete len:83 (-) Transcript_33518:56-304(-)
MDFNMPRVSGREAVAQMRAKEKACGLGRVPIVMLSGESRTSVLPLCLDAGADAFLEKPVERVRLVQMLRDFCGLCDEPQSDQ